MKLWDGRSRCVTTPVSMPTCPEEAAAAEATGSKQTSMACALSLCSVSMERAMTWLPPSLRRSSSSTSCDAARRAKARRSAACRRICAAAACTAAAADPSGGEGRRLPP